MIKKQNNQKRKVIILGGGLAGLAAAYELAKTGFNVVVIEKSDDVGGLARTIKVGKFSFDTGPHRWYTKNDSVNNWMLEILGKEVIKVPRLTRIYFDGKFFFYPIRIMNALKGIGIINAFNAVFDYLKSRIKSRIGVQQALTMEDGYIRQFGKTLYEIFFKRYSEKLWGRKCNEISIDWVGQRTRGLNIITLIKDSLIKSKNVVSLVDEFSYPKNGIGMLAWILEKKVKFYGGKIILNSDVVKIHNNKKNKITKISYKKGKKIFDLEGDYYISSIPLNDLVYRFSPKMSEKTEKVASRLTYRDELQVALFIKKTHITNDTWIYIHPKEIPYMRLMEMDNWSDKLSPKGTTSLVFEIACNEGDEIWNKKDKEIIDLTVNSFIDEFKFISKKDIISGYVHRVLKEYPVYHLNYLQDVDFLKKNLKNYHNLQIIGRNGTFRYNNMDHSIEMGLYAAWNIINGSVKYDIESVNIEREYLEEKNIENIEDERVDEG
jgi:protoporphyrinogen oxidase